jgi:hypothetical protein
MPAAVMTYTSLVADLKTYSERPNDVELSAQIPQIVLLTESELAADLRVLGNALVVSSTLVAGTASIAKPSYWRRTTSFSITVPATGRQDLFKRPYEYLRNFWPNAALTGVPRFYAEYNYNNFFVAPTPDIAYPFELIYFARLDPLSATNQSNWFTVNAPQLLLFNGMHHVSLFLKNFDKADAWKARYKDAVASLQLEDGARVYDRTTVEA